MIACAAIDIKEHVMAASVDASFALVVVFDIVFIGESEATYSINPWK